MASSRVSGQTLRRLLEDRAVVKQATARAILGRCALRAPLLPSVERKPLRGRLFDDQVEESAEKVDLWRRMRRPGAKAPVFAGFS